MKTIFTIATLVVMALAIFFALSRFGDAREVRAALAELETQRSKMKESTASAEQQLAAAEHDQQELQVALEKIKSPAGTAPAAAAKKADTRVPPPNASETLALFEANPELRTLFKRSMQAGLTQRFRPFYLSANLTADQIAKFEEIMVQDAEDKLTLAAIVQKQGVASDDSAMPKMRQQMNEKMKAAQKEVLGDAAYDQLQQLGRSEPAVGFISEFSTLMTEKSSSLTESQALKLREVFMSASPAYQAGGRIDTRTLDWPRALADAQTFLSPPQFEALRAQAQLPQIFNLVRQYYNLPPPPPGK